MHRTAFMACRLGILYAFLLLLLCSRLCDGDVSTPHICKDDGKCFTVILEQQLSWDHAEEYCENNLLNGRLASVHNAFDNAIIAGWLPFLSTNPWIGAFRVASLPFSWADGTDFNQYNNWASGQPREHCALVCRSTTNAGSSCEQGKWTTADCGIQAPFICEYGNLTEATSTNSIPSTTTHRPVASCSNLWAFFAVTQACYRTFYKAVSWDDAEATCRNNGGHLTSIHSDAENNFIGDLASEHSVDEDWFRQTYIGMVDLKHDRHWSWTDGTSVDYFHWYPGEPNNNGGAYCGHYCPEYCVELYSDFEENDVSKRYRWNDIACEEPMRAFVCKREPNWS